MNIKTTGDLFTASSNSHSRSRAVEWAKNKKKVCGQDGVKRDILITFWHVNN